MSVSARESGARLREEVQRALARSAKETTRVWFEQTVGNCGRWRGNDSESCRLAVEQSCQARDGFGGEPAPAASVSGWGVAKYHAAFELMRSEYCDDKLAGMIMFEVRRATTARPVPVGSLPSDTSRMLGRAFPARARARRAPPLPRVAHLSRRLRPIERRSSCSPTPPRPTTCSPRARPRAEKAMTRTYERAATWPGRAATKRRVGTRRASKPTRPKKRRTTTKNDIPMMMMIGRLLRNRE